MTEKNSTSLVDSESADDREPPVEEVVFLPESVKQLRQELVKSDELERTAFVRCAPSGDRLLVTDVRVIPDEQMGRQGRAECRPELDVERSEIHEAIDSGWVVLHVHSHPFANLPSFSSADRRIMPKLSGYTRQMYDGATIFFAVIGRQGIRATWYNAEAEEFSRVSATVLGGWELKIPLTGAANSVPERIARRAEEESVSTVDDRFDRHLRAFGEDGQQRFLAAEITVVGVGGLGSSIAEQLARIGIGKINLIDPDHLEQSNLPRVYGAYESDIGVPKVETVRTHLKRINSNIELTVHNARVEADSVAPALKRSDAVIAGLDQMSSRGFLNQFCIRHGIPYFDAGVVIRTDNDSPEADEDMRLETMEGFLQTVIPGTTACFDCLNRVDPHQTRIERLPDEDVDVEVEEGYVEGTALSPEPAVVTLNTTVAGLAVSELSNYLTGTRPPRGFLHYEAVQNEISLLNARSSRNSACPTCGEHGVLLHGEVTEPTDIGLPESVDDDLKSIPTPNQVDGTQASTENAIEDGGVAATTEQKMPAAETKTPTNKTRPVGESDDSSKWNKSGLDMIRDLSDHVQEVLPWK